MNFFLNNQIHLLTGPLHIPAKRPGFETDPTVIRHPHPWGSYEAGFDSQYHSHSQYYLERDRKPVYYGYPDSAQFPQVRNVCQLLMILFFQTSQYIRTLG